MVRYRCVYHLFIPKIFKLLCIAILILIGIASNAQDTSIFYQSKEDGKVVTFIDAQEAQIKLKGWESRLKSTTDLDWYGSQVVNPYVRPNYRNAGMPHLDYVGSGDADGDGDRDMDDVQLIRDGADNYRTKVLGNAETTSADADLLELYINRGTHHLPGDWERLDSTEKVNWFEKMYLNFDDVQLIVPDKLCYFYSGNFWINFAGGEKLEESGYNLDEIIDISKNGWINLPVYGVYTRTTNDVAHSINAIFVGTDDPTTNTPLNFDAWYFFEPQLEQRVHPGDLSIDKDSYIHIQRFCYNNYLGEGLEHYVMPVVHFVLEDGIDSLTVQHPDLVTSPESYPPINNEDLPDYIQHPMYGLNYFVPAYSPDFATNKDFYGSGDVDGDGDIDMDDYNSTIAGTDPFNDGTYRGDIDLDGESGTTADKQIILEYLNGERTHVNMWELESKEQQENHLEKALAIDPTDKVPYNPNGGWLCYDFTNQLFINFNGIYNIANSFYAEDNDSNLQYDLNHNGIFRIPIRYMDTKMTNNVAHQINFVYISDAANEDIKNLNHKMKIEPQLDVTFYENNNVPSMNPNEYAKEFWHGYYENIFDGWKHGARGLCEYSLSNGQVTITYENSDLVTSWEPFRNNGVEGVTLTYPVSRTLEANQNVLAEANQIIEDSEVTGILYPEYTQITRTTTNNQDPDPTKSGHYNFTIDVLYEATAGKYSDTGNSTVSISDTQDPVYDATSETWSDASGATLITNEEITVSEDVCQPDTIITRTATDPSGNIGTDVEVKTGQIYEGVPYLVSDPSAGDTLELQLGQDELPQYLGGWPVYEDERAYVNISYSVEEVEWRGSYWLKRMIFTAENECGNTSTDTVYRYYIKPSATGINSLSQESDIVVYPNPATNTIFVSLPKSPNRLYRVELIDLMGRMLWSKEVYQERIEIDVSEYSDGIYLINVYNSLEFIQGQKIVIRRF